MVAVEKVTRHYAREDGVALCGALLPEHQVISRVETEVITLDGKCCDECFRELRAQQIQAKGS